jgi:thymidylate synthase (FAD)
MGSDLTVVNAARVSFSKTKEEMEANDTKLIAYLAKHNHWTPFSHPQIMMREKVPIFVARQRFKHMVGFTYNEVSRRYVDDRPTFFTPDVWRSRPEGSVKQGSGDKDLTNSRLESGFGYEGTVQDHYEEFIESAEGLYEDMLKTGVAPEQARMVLPQSMYTEYYVTGSLSAWARAYKQRIDSHAQQEIQALAYDWGNIIAPLYPQSWEALTQ